MITATSERRVLPRDHRHRVHPEEVGLEIRVEEVVREQLYRVGDRVILSQTDLSEIIFFYQNLAMQLGAEMHRLVAVRISNATPPA